jgi:hypothetical protein
MLDSTIVRAHSIAPARKKEAKRSVAPEVD